MKIDVKHIAKLANLTLISEEESKFEKQLSDILTYVEKLREVDTKNTEQTAQVTGLENAKREDSNTQVSLSQDEALSGTKNKHNGFFKVKAIFEEK